jgi:hypothetical protein
MKKNIFLTLALALTFVGTAWGQTTDPFEVTSITFNGNYPFVYDGNPKTYITNFADNCSFDNAILTGNTETNAGSYTATISSQCYGHGIGTHPDYYEEFHVGSVTYNWSILPRDISKTDYTDYNVSITVNDKEWTGSEINISTVYTIKFKDANLNAADYDVYVTKEETPTTIKDEGRYTIVFTGKGNFTGTVTKTFDVKKDMSAGESVTGIHFDIPTQIKNGTFDFSVVATDTKSHTTLHEGTDFTMAFKTSDNTDIAENAIADQGKYKVIFSGVAPKYNGTRTVEFYVVNPYQLVAAGEYAAVSLHITEPGYPVAANSPTGAVVIGEMQVGANGAAAVDATAKRVLIPANNTVSVGGTGIVFNIVGIENGAFNGCTELRFIDARLIANYTPSSLNRTATNTPFTGLPKQTLVYLTGSTVEGENYIYDTGAGLNCETFKIYDDISGTQTGFTSATDAKWDMEIPVAFTANNIVNTRKLTAVANNKQQGYTVCLPYALPIPESVTAYQLSYSKTDMLGFTEVAATGLTAMRPYVLIPSASGQCLSTTNATVSQTVKYESAEWVYEACTADPASSSAASGQSLYKLTGSMQYKEGDAAKEKYIMQGNNEWGQIAAGAGYSVTTDHSCILPMRAYIEANGTATARLFSTFNNADGSTTVVKGLQIDANDKAEVYDLQGRKVSAPQRNGLYIVNGKKVVMK